MHMLAYVGFGSYAVVAFIFSLAGCMGVCWRAGEGHEREGSIYAYGLLAAGFGFVAGVILSFLVILDIGSTQDVIPWGWLIAVVCTSGCSIGLSAFAAFVARDNLGTAAGEPDESAGSEAPAEPATPSHSFFGDYGANKTVNPNVRVRTLRKR